MQLANRYPADGAHVNRPVNDVLVDNDIGQVTSMLRRLGLFDEQHTKIIKVGICLVYSVHRGTNKTTRW